MCSIYHFYKFLHFLKPSELVNKKTYPNNPHPKGTTYKQCKPSISVREVAPEETKKEQIYAAQKK